MRLNSAINKIKGCHFLLCLLCWSVVGGCSATNIYQPGKDKVVIKAHSFAFKNGDIIFQDLDCGPLCDAIESVTAGYWGMPLSHIAIVEIINGNIQVIEAIGKNVHKTPIDTFLNRIVNNNGNPKIILGRLKSAYKNLLPKAIAFCNNQLGKQYDDAFLPNNDKYYCSELLYDAFKYANNNKPFFTLQPMTFKDKKTNNFFGAWVDYFAALKMEIPEGIEGCNPAGIANDEKIEIVNENSK
ncbi:MAG: YiiX/YebB-like N1pC/P60 family cysteine hydrolase [Ferruginibacter sp.]